MSGPVEPEQDPDGDLVGSFEDTADGADDGPDDASPGYNTLSALPGLAGWSEMAKKSESLTGAYRALYPTVDFSGFKVPQVPQLPTSAYDVLAGSPSRTNALVGNFEMLGAVNARPYEGLAAPFAAPMVHIMAGTNELLADLVAHGEAAAREAASVKRTERRRFWITTVLGVLVLLAAVGAIVATLAAAP